MAENQFDDPVAALYEKFGDDVYNICAKWVRYYHPAHDLTSDVFFRVCQRANKGTLPDSAGLPWLIGIAKNVLKENRRKLEKQQKEFDQLKQLGREFYYADDSTEVVAAKRHAELAMRELSKRARLSRGQYEVFVVRQYLTDEKTAEALGIAVGTVKSRHSRAKAKLQGLGEAAVHESLFDTSDWR